MSRDRRTAAVVGILYIIGTVAGVLSVVSTGSVLGAEDYGAALSAHGTHLVIGALFVLTMGLALAMVPVMAYSILRGQNQTLAVGCVVFRGALETVTYMATVIGWLSLLGLRHAYGQAGPPNAAGFQALSTVLLEGEVIGFVTTVVFILGAVLFCCVLYGSNLVPRWIPGWGLVSAMP